MRQHLFTRPEKKYNTFADLKGAGGFDENYLHESFYKEHIPEFVAAALERLYGNIYCTLGRISAYESLEGISTYVSQRQSVIEAIILFRDEGQIISIVNQQITLPANAISSFCESVFSRYKNAKVVRFYAIDTHLTCFSRFFQQTVALQENVINLPSEKSIYLSSIRPQFRKQILISGQNIKADHPTFQMHLGSQDAIKAETVQAVLKLAQKRMLAKGKTDYTGKINTVALVKLMKSHGHIAFATINGNVCGGAMWLSVGKRHFHQIAAHDPEYDRYMLGNQLWMTAILRCLDLGGKECWLMGGADAHKARFRAEKRTFHSIIIYRSKLCAFFSLQIFVPCWSTQQAARLQAAAILIAHRPDRAGRLVAQAIAVIRSLRATMRERHTR
ncbi:GNAT family N-acetyltransferase [Telluria aromaticivorans]|uniref:GNAT family N-acetyltransferase n=1 Tax=Telluria aromaticivorans TaxID=2725995 RepID=A0A7Y2K1Y8_9BURK|nr:GNAT family N-acetyltransferase [Telluria aromaticivorans]NNG25130.1 GNAT family N-acetyltransferase [Telluria aromaticivorans]